MKSVIVLSAASALFFASVFAQNAAQSSASSSASSFSATGSASSSSSTGSVQPSGTASLGNSTVSPTTSGTAAASATGGATYQTPGDISANCTAFLNDLDTDSQFGTCTQSLLTATDSFASQSSPDATAVTSTLNTLCVSTGCSDTYIRTQLVHFYTACKAELAGSNPNTVIKETYDILYIMNPLKKALCLKDSDDYCVLKGSTNSTATNSTLTSTNNVLSSDGTVNTQAYRDDGVMYLYATPSLDAADLCNNCTQQVLATYGSWEVSVPYGAGLANSPMLGGQAALWTGVSNKCGSTYVQKIQASIGTSTNTAAGTMNAAVRLGPASGLMALLAVAISFVFAL